MKVLAGINIHHLDNGPSSISFQKVCPLRRS